MRLIEVVADSGHMDTLISIAVQHAADYWLGTENPDKRQSIRLLVTPDKRQAVLDALQGDLGGSEDARILVIPLEASLPRPAEEEQGSEEKSAIASREELYASVEKGAWLDSNYLLLVLLSTVVAAIGLLENNAAVVIGAMVIAPLLGPNIALALGTALGDTKLMGRAAITGLAGLALAVAASVLIGLLWPLNVESRELLARTDVGLDGVALALASGAAAVLSLTTGLSAVLVGVMVSVALLPPAATMGLMLGSGQWNMAVGAGLLLAVNIVCVNLAAKVVLRFKGVKPRTWLEKQKARQSMTAYTLIWLFSLILLLAVIYLRHSVLNP